ncbi:MAG: DUF1622 domain-containing protein [Gemmatimonadaceae bacterium]
MSALDAIRALIFEGAEWLRLALETSGALTIAIGAAVTLSQMARHLAAHQHVSFTDARLGLSRYLALALELQLAADVLETAIAPEWAKIGQLAAIAAIRTALNYFLSKEIVTERKEVNRAAA